MFFLAKVIIWVLLCQWTIHRIQRTFSQLKAFASSLENFGLGLSLNGEIELRAHHPRWIEAANNEIARISRTIACSNVSIHHIGSTAIASICAKPILDFLFLVPSKTKQRSFDEAFDLLGYHCKGEGGVPGRRYFVLCDQEKKKSYVHIHMFPENHSGVAEYLLFRDYLVANSDVAKQYEKLKMAHSAKVKSNRAQYTEAKTAFIEDVICKARKLVCS